ncbi:MAG: HEAT repeat domain-containing protein [Anaerolineae bacterium]|nr:HEAT repeat domain-containing protein [Anaerolineae bacterium]
MLSFNRSELLSRFTDDDPDIRKNAILELKNVVDEHVDEVLIELLRDPHPQVRLAAVDALGLRGNKAVDPLLTLFSDEDQNVRYTAAAMLPGSMNHLTARGNGDGTYTAMPVKPSRLAKDVIPKLAAMVQNRRNKVIVRETAAWALSGYKGEVVIRTLLDALADPSPKVRAHVAESLGSLHTKRAGEPLLKLLDGDHVNVQIATMIALTRINYSEAAPRIAEYLDSRNPELIALACDLVGELRYKPASDHLVKLLTHKIWWIRSNAAIGLGKLKMRTAITPLMQRLTDKNAIVRGAIARALAELAAKRAIPILKPMLFDEKESVRLWAARSLVQLGEQDDDICDVLKDLQAASEKWIQRRATNTLAQISCG